MTLTLEFARASAQDAANMQMRRAGRTRWSEADYNLACETLYRLLPHVGEEYARIAAALLD